MAFDPQLDVSLELELGAASHFYSIIGILRWMTEHGRIDIITKMSLLSSHLALLIEGHLETAVYVMASVGQKHNSRLVHNPTYPFKVFSFLGNVIEQSFTGISRRLCLKCTKAKM